MDLQEKQDLKRFLAHAALFVLPFAILLGIPFAIMTASGELMSVDRVIALEKSNEPLLHGPAYSDPTRYHKLQRAIQDGPDVVAYGASRVMEFPKSFFRDPETFYNMGGIGELQYHLPMLKKIPDDNLPKTIILSVDPMDFSPWRWENPAPLQYDSDEPPSRTAAFIHAWPEVYKDLWKGKISLDRVFHHDPRTIGLNAIMRGDGFHNDGSHQWGILNEDEAARKASLDEEVRKLVNGITSGSSGYAREDGPEPRAIAMLDEFLAYCKTKNIHVTAFIPPMAHEGMEMLRTKRPNSYVFRLTDTLTPVFEKYDYKLFTFLDPIAFGSSDEEMIDSGHGSEKMYARFTAIMAKGDPGLAAVLMDADTLQKSVEASDHPYFPAR